MVPFPTSLKIRIVHEIVHIAKKTSMLDVLFYLLYRQCLKGLAQAKIIKKSVILFRVLNMTI